MIRSEAQISMILLIGDHNWRHGPLWPAICAFCHGRRETIRTHLGDTATIAWWRDRPFLIRIRRSR
jgi:hypothetical protein